MAQYRFVKDENNALGDFHVGDVIELDAAHPWVVAGLVAPVETEVDDLPEDAPVEEVDDTAAHTVHRKASSRKAKG